MATEDQASSVPVQKFSRYRSVRNPKSSAFISPPPTPHASSTVTEPLKRSLSRYRSNQPANLAVSPPKVLPATTQSQELREGTQKLSATRETRDVLPLREKGHMRAQDGRNGDGGNGGSGRGVPETSLRHDLKQPNVEQPLVSRPSREALAVEIYAPLSAINAGERNVRVKYNQTSVFVRVAPATTTTDLLCSATEKLSENIDIGASMVLECIPQLGLERPLRTYEHIRDVMNSWDDDAQNHLIIGPSTTGGLPGVLDFDKAARGQPGEKKIYMYHSHQPGKWDKRWITLRSDGQVLLAKKDGGKTTNICHISDFDIYVPTRRQMRELRPPKKPCYGIKSQQKSSMFLTTANYLHFFSSGDASLAADWYQAVHEWRSWYLVTVLGKGHKKAVTLVDSNQADYNHGIPATTRIVRRSADMPLAAVHSLRKERDNRDLVRQPTRLTSDKTPTKGAINVSPIARTLGAPIGRGASSREKGEETFAAIGLLGQTYEQRPKAQRDRDAASAREGPFLPGLLVGETSIAARHGSPNTGRWQHQSGTMPTTDRDMAGSISRTMSKRQKSTPLVDLTSYQVLPRSRGEGRAIVPEHLPAGGLIDLATGPENTSRPGTSGEESAFPHRGVRPGSASQTGSLSFEGTKNAVNDEDHAYLAGGLLARAGTGQGGSGTGRGVMTGDRQAKEPMLDVSEPSIYAPGSLLAQAEMRTVKERPVRERVDGREVSIPMGEGV
ncbi:Ubiquitin-related domain [Lasallia pustulata]|uniref:Ubiquitin-related domain n=1 Tax=Lasallia pustulata TaxID=136370 RepID=A0A1W5CWH5_9LECA|nr:Ubiquitin-related domain [Lasallia pustulata]